MNALQDQHVLILGLGISGLSMARWCVRHGAQVTVADTRESPPSLAALRAECPAAQFVAGAFDQALLSRAHWNLIARSPGRCLRYALAPGLEDGMAVAYARRGRGAPHVPDTPAPMARPRPPPSALLELHTLQALDATLAGASLREVGEGLFGADAVADWYTDGGLRSKVRRLVRRGEALMCGGYRRLAQLPPLEKGRFEGDAKRP